MISPKCTLSPENNNGILPDSLKGLVLGKLYHLDLSKGQQPDNPILTMRYKQALNL